MGRLAVVTRWFFAVAVFPLLWVAICAVGLFGSLDVMHVASLALIVVIAYLTQPVWIWKLGHASDGWERRSRLLMDTPAAVFPAVVVAAVSWAWVTLSRHGSGSGAPIASLPGEEWRLWILAFPFVIVLFGWAFATLREERAPLTLSAALSLPISAPVLWVCICMPVTV
jgi:hypothetical protein